MLDYNLKISKFSINHFRRFEKIDFTFGESNYFAIVGKNGIGKTAILEAINLCLSDNSSKYNDIRETDFCSDEPIVFNIEFSNYFFFKFQDPETGIERLIPCNKFKKIISRRSTKEKLALFSSPYEIKYEYEIEDYNPSSSEFKKTKAFIQANVASNLIQVRHFKTDEDGSFKFQIESDDRWRDPNIKFGIERLPKVLFPKIFYFDKNRERELLDGYSTTFSKVITELNWRIKREIAKLETTEREELIKKYTDLHDGVKKLDTYKKALIDPVLIQIKERLGIDIDHEEMEFFFMDILNPYRSSLFGHKTDHDKIVPITNYGSGISSLISLSFLIEFAMKAKECIIILIDEPEIHLHPDLEKRLKKILSDSHFQSIVSTHSHLFLDKDKPKNNICLDINKDNEVSIRYCNQIDLADVQFRLLGSSLDDLYIPQEILLVEGVYDKKILSKCLELLGHEKYILQLLDCEGYTDIPSKADKYNKAIELIIEGTNKYKNFITQKLRILVDGDVSTTIVDGWKQKFISNNLDIKHFEANIKGLEYIYPESLVKLAVENVTVQDDSALSLKTKEEIVQIILEDDKKSEDFSQKTNRLSKNRLNEYVVQNITQEILNSEEGSDLKKIIEWIANITS